MVSYPKETNHPHYDVRKRNEQHLFDLLYMLHNVSEGNTYKYILPGIDFASKFKFARPLRTKKSRENGFLVEAIYKKGGVFKYPKLFQCNNGSEFKNEVTTLHEKHNVDIQRATAKYRHTHASFVEAFNKELAKFLSKLMGAQGFQDHEKVWTIWVKNLSPTVKKMNDTKSLMIDMKPEDATKLGTVPLDIQKKPYYLRMVYTDIYISLMNNTETKKD